MATMTSLAILNPAPSQLVVKTPRRSPTALYLENKTRRIVDFIDKKDFSNPEISDLIAPDMAAAREFHLRGTSNALDDWLENYRVFAKQNPDYYCEVVSISATVNEKNGTATVWLLLKVTGHPSTLQRENVTVTHWKRRQGKWRAYKQTGMRGFGGVL